MEAVLAVSEVEDDELLEVYVPVRARAGRTVEGVLEAYLPYAPVARAIAEDTWRLIVVLFGGMDDLSAAALLCALPIATWEFGLGCWLMAKGFRSSPVLDFSFSTAGQPAPVHPQAAASPAQQTVGAGTLGTR